jgi:hypothetical protein
MTEPDAGSDLQGIKTRAIRQVMARFAVGTGRVEQTKLRGSPCGRRNPAEGRPSLVRMELHDGVWSRTRSAARDVGGVNGSASHPRSRWLWWPVTATDPA